MSGIELIDKIVPKNNGAFPVFEDTDGKGGFRVVPNLAARDAIFALDLKFGMVVYVADANKIFYRLEQVSPVVWNAITVLTDPIALTQSVWHVNATTGNNNNSGLTSGTAVQDLNEIVRRWWGGLVTQVAGVDIFVESNLPIPVNLVGFGVSAGTQIRFHGTMTQLRTGTLSAVQVAVPATNTPYTLSDAAVANWNTDSNQLLRITSGAAVGAVCYVDQQIVATTARVSQVVSVVPGGTGATPPPSPPSPGDTYEIVTLSTIQIGILDVSLSGGFVTIPLVFDGFNITNTGGDAPNGSNLVFFNCKMFLREVNADSFLVTILTNCFFSGLLTSGRVQITAGLIKNAFVIGYGRASCVANVIAIGLSVIVRSCVVLDSTSPAGLEGIGVFDSPGDAFVIEPSGVLSGTEIAATPARLWGAGNVGFGMRVQSRGIVNYDASRVPTVTGTLGDFALATDTSTRPFDNTAGVYAAPVATDTGGWANLVAATPGGFGGSVVSPVNGAAIIRT